MTLISGSQVNSMAMGLFVVGLVLGYSAPRSKLRPSYSIEQKKTSAALSDDIEDDSIEDAPRSELSELWQRFKNDALFKENKDGIVIELGLHEVKVLLQSDELYLERGLPLNSKWTPVLDRVQSIVRSYLPPERYQVKVQHWLGKNEVLFQGDKKVQSEMGLSSARSEWVVNYWKGQVEGNTLKEKFTIIATDERVAQPRVSLEIELIR